MASLKSRLSSPGPSVDSSRIICFRRGNVTDTVRGLRPDAVVLLEVPAHAKWLVNLTPEMVDELFSKEDALAYKEAKVLPKCPVVCDGFLTRYQLQRFSILFRRWPTLNADTGKRVKELKA